MVVSKPKKRLQVYSKPRKLNVTASRKLETNGTKHLSKELSKQEDATITRKRKRKAEDDEPKERRFSKRGRVTKFPFQFAETQAQTKINVKVTKKQLTNVSTTPKVSKKEPRKPEARVTAANINKRKLKEISKKSQSRLALKKGVASLTLLLNGKKTSKKVSDSKVRSLSKNKRLLKKSVAQAGPSDATNNGSVVLKNKILKKGVASSRLVLNGKKTSKKVSDSKVLSLTKNKRSLKKAVAQAGRSDATNNGSVVLKKRNSRKHALEPKLYVTEYVKDPTFETNEIIPYVSTLAHSRLLIRAVILKDTKLLKSLIHDKKSICSFTVPRSLNINRDAFSYAVEKQNMEAIKILLNSKLVENLARFPDIILTDERTGYNSTMMFGHALRKVTVGRGGKEGNNALLKDRSSYESYQKSVNFITHDIVKEALTFGFPRPLIQKLSEIFPHLQSTTYTSFYSGIVFAIRAGHNQLAGELVEDAITVGGYGFNLLHKEVLLNTTQALTPFKSISAVKKCISNERITPVHCAAINPNSAYLTAVLNSRPDYGVLDMQNWSAIHYAAVCTGTGPLQVLLSRGISTVQMNKDGDTPLHLASALGRIENVKLILQNEKENDQNDSEDDAPKDIAGSLVKRTNKIGQTALHKASECGQTAVVEILLNAGADSAKFTPARYDKLTPFMFAARHGHVDVLKVFVQHGVKVDAVDHKGRTALTHAVINGQGHVVSYLLRIGANNLKKDTSGNTMIHYAAAYGWYFCLKLLIEAGCPPNEPNDWKMTPLAISFMKGHMGLVEYILKQSGVDINSRVNDSTGVTLLLQAAASKPTSEFYSRMKFLLVDQNADCNIVDFEGNNAFHYLVRTEYREKSENTKYENSETQKFVFQATKLLWDHKCNPCATNFNQESAVFVAIQHGCFSILNKLFDLSCQLPEESNKDGNTLLHVIVTQLQNDQATAICKRWAKDPEKLAIMKKMAKTYNTNGYTPLLWLLDRITVVADANFLKNIIEFMIFLVCTLDGDIAAIDRMKKSGQSVVHLASQVSYAEQAFQIIFSKHPSLEVLNYSLQTPLALSITNEKKEATKALLNAGANINFKTKNGESLTLLHAMKQNKSFDLIPLMIDKGANIHEVNIHTKNSLLHYICKKPHLPFAVESVKKLVEKKINVNAVNKDGNTALHLAVNFRAGETDASYDVENALIESKAKLNIRNIRGRIPLHLAFVKIMKHSDGSFMDPIELVTTLVRAMKYSLPNFGDEIKLADEFGCTSLHYAAVRGATISCSYLLMETNGSVDIQDGNGNTPFGLAVLHGHEGCALQFQQHGANFIQNLNTNLSQNPLTESTNTSWQWEFIKMKKTEYDRKKFDKDNYPILQEVVRKDWQGILHLMLEKLNNSGAGATFAIAAAINTNRLKLTRKLVNRARPSELTVNENSENLLHILAKSENNDDQNRELIKEIVEILVSKGVSYTALDKNQSTALIYASVHRKFFLCSLLEQTSINDGVALKYADKFGRTPFTASFWKIKAKTEFSMEFKLWLESLLTRGALANICCRYPIIIHPYPGVRYLKCETQVNFASGRYSPLMMAVITGNYSIVKWLLTMKHADLVDVNFQDDDGRTALMHAVRLNDIKMVRLILNPKTYDHIKDVHPWQIRTSKLQHGKHMYFDLKDKKGWTVMDHIVAVHEGNFCYSNSDVIVRLLYSAGAVINNKSDDGISPLDRAIKMKRIWLVDCMEELLELSKDKRTTFPKAKDEIFNIDVNNELCNSLITTYSSDCQSETENIMEVDEGSDSDDDLNQVKPDDLVQDDNNDQLKVIFDKEQKVYFSCCLTKVDISYGVYGIYNFYKMQLLKEERGKEMIFLFTRWGRVGDNGQYQKTPFISEDEAIKEFKKIFRSKTGNTWDNLEAFTVIPKKYRLVATESRKKPKQVKIDFEKFKNTHSLKTTKLSPSLLSLMENLTLVHKTNIKFAGFEQEYANELPFGLLTCETLKKGAGILEEIEELIKKRDELRTQPGYSTTNEISFMESVLKPCEEFYALIPVYGFSKEKLKPMFNQDDLREKQKVIHKLIHLEFASQLLIAAQFNLGTVNPFEYIFRCLNTKLEALVEGEEETQLILQYIHNTSMQPESASKPPKIIRIFRIERAGEKERMEKSGIGNPHLLWHGTSAENMLSILHRGLMVTPLEANLSGHLFGKGIYFADMFMKSAKYVHGSNPKNMLLCEVALGKIHPIKLNYCEVQSNKPLPPTHHSLKTMDSKWEPDPESTLLWKGRTVPLGRPIQNILPANQYHCLDHNEFVVFREDQVKLRYLIQFEDTI